MPEAQIDVQIPVTFLIYSNALHLHFIMSRSFNFVEMKYV